MKKTLTILIISFMLITINAQTITDEINEVTPDMQPAYFFDRVSEVFEGLPYMLNNNSRAEWALKLADERLLEAKIMAQRGYNADNLLAEYAINTKVALEKNPTIMQTKIDELGVRAREVQTIMEQNNIQSQQQIIVKIENITNDNKNNNDSILPDTSYFVDLRGIADPWLAATNIDDDCEFLGGTWTYSETNVSCTGLPIIDCLTVDKILARDQCVAVGGTWICGDEGIGCFYG